MSDATLDQLLQEVRQACATLARVEAELCRRGAGEDELISLKDGERELGRSNIQLRRWAKEEGLGVLVDGKWFLRRSLVREYKQRR